MNAERNLISLHKEITVMHTLVQVWDKSHWGIKSCQKAGVGGLLGTQSSPKSKFSEISFMGGGGVGFSEYFAQSSPLSKVSEISY